MKNIIGVDAGATSIKAGKVEKGKVVAYSEEKTPKTRKAFMDALFRVIGALKDRDTKAIGIGFPAPVVEGKVLEVQNIPPLGGTNISAAVGRKFKVRCHVENDANAFAVSEHRFGAAKGKRNVAAITLGTGVGCGLIINGELYAGNTGAAGEISRIPADGDNLENYANAKFIKRISGKTGEELGKLARRGDKRALKTWKDYGKNVGKIIAVVVDAVDPEVVVLGGNIAKAYPFFQKEIMPQLRRHCFRNTASKARVVRSKIIKDSAILGAAAVCG